MDDQQVRELLTNMLTNLDADAEYELRHENFVAEMPQSRERIRGRANMRALQRAFPPERGQAPRARPVWCESDAQLLWLTNSTL
jgi:hypothetical protein